MPSRRKILSVVLTLGGVTALAGLLQYFRKAKSLLNGEAMIKNQFSLDFQWPVQEPFLFCVHHYDFYPAAHKDFGPEPRLLEGRNMGQDFVAKDGFRMYHGETVPGFPVHPHRGFETVTIVRKGYVDHADSLGAAGRYGEGDVQWMTAGGGVQHSEMFPLLRSESENTLELFQIWLNLPRKSKMVPAHFKMFWSEKIPKLSLDDGRVSVNLIAGEMDGRKALAPPPDSWASDSENEVSILLVKFSKGGRFVLPASRVMTNRTLYYFEGSGLELNGKALSSRMGFNIDSQADLELRSPNGEAEVLVLQARPIGEPTYQHGPFVMNTREEIVRTIDDYRRTQFGGWPWPRQDMVHGSEIARFAKYPDGKIEKPT